MTDPDKPAIEAVLKQFRRKLFMLRDAAGQLISCKCGGNVFRVTERGNVAACNSCWAVHELERVPAGGVK